MFSVIKNTVISPKYFRFLGCFLNTKLEKKNVKQIFPQQNSVKKEKKRLKNRKTQRCWDKKRN